MKKNSFSDIIALTCVIFAPLTLIWNIMYGITINIKSLLSFGAIAIISVLIFLICSIIVIVKDNKIKFLKNKRNMYILSSIWYSGLSFFINGIAWAIQSEKSGMLWNLYTIITVLCFSIAISVIHVYFYKKGFAFKAVVYLLVTAIPYFVLLTGITDFFKGTKVFIPISAYTLVYGILAIYYGINAYKNKEKSLNEKPYENMFK